MCAKNNTTEPHIFTEFGSYTVGESGAVLYSILDEKLQNDKELWYMIDGSFITQLPDSWGLNQKYIMLAINNWDETFHNISLGGLTCDSMDYYNSEANEFNIYLPKIESRPDAIHWILPYWSLPRIPRRLRWNPALPSPAPKHVLIDRDEDGNVTHRLFAKDQTQESMLKTLGY